MTNGVHADYEQYRVAPQCIDNLEVLLSVEDVNVSGSTDPIFHGEFRDVQRPNRGVVLQSGGRYSLLSGRDTPQAIMPEDCG